MNVAYFPIDDLVIIIIYIPSDRQVKFFCWPSTRNASAWEEMLTKVDPLLPECTQFVINTVTIDMIVT